MFDFLVSSFSFKQEDIRNDTTVKMLLIFSKWMMTTGVLMFLRYFVLYWMYLYYELEKVHAESTDSFGKYFVAHLIYPSQYQDNSLHEAELFTIFLGDTECTSCDNMYSRCGRTNVNHTVSPLVLNFTEVACLYTTVRLSTSGISYTMLVYPVDYLGNRYRTVGLTLQTGQYKSWHQICHVTAIYNSTEVQINNDIKVYLNELESFEINDTLLTDFTGSLVESNNTVSVVCGGYSMIHNDTESEVVGVLASHIPPTDTWGHQFLINLSGVMDDINALCVKYVFSEQHTVLRLRGVADIGEYHHQNVDSDTERQLLHCNYLQNFLQTGNIDVHSTRNILTALFMELNGSQETRMVIVTPLEQRSNIVTRSDNCEIEPSFYNASFIIFQNNQIAAVQTLSTIKIHHNTSIKNESTGDGMDNDDDGFVDEDFCQSEISDSNITLTDVDFDGRTEEDCRGCSEGFELNSTLGCSECQIGYYRKKGEPDVCHRCKNLTTLYRGAVTQDQCVVNCGEGEEFDNATESCRLCDIGFYKNVSSTNTTASFHDRWYCKRCSVGSTTIYNGTEQEYDCIESCQSGHELDNLKLTCVPCGWNRYKFTSSDSYVMSFEDRWKCRNCSAGKVTMTNHSEYCVDECGKGYEFNASLEECLPCEKGYYKNTTGNFDSCVPCPVNTTTADTGTEDAQDCTDGCWCPCHMVSPYQNYSAEELEQKLQILRENLALNKRKLVSYTSTKISTPDDRLVSRALGSMGSMVIAGVVIILILFDIALFKRHTKMFIVNIRDFYRRIRT